MYLFLSKKSAGGRLMNEKSAGGLLSEKGAGGRLQMAYVGGGCLVNRLYGMGDEL